MKKLIFISVAITLLVACKKDDHVSNNARAQDNLAPVPASQFRWNK